MGHQDNIGTRSLGHAMHQQALNHGADIARQQHRAVIGFNPQDTT